ncbi:hypothetical protein AQUCO_06600054v1 [Aquilegia coerulea]|uniref:Cell differentiation protein rcd1 n=1 Tax=Aquilegia coerulea TaxID=218851 RepID=A0A2G5CC41_AQUCA|nr:hypothetical protein AQUCO_06600054v1 [Aquilegia coerulea]
MVYQTSPLPPSSFSSSSSSSFNFTSMPTTMNNNNNITTYERKRNMASSSINNKTSCYSGSCCCNSSNGGVTKQVEELVLQITNPLLRPHAILELRQMRNICFGCFAPWLWYSFGTIAALLQEIVSVYPALLSAKLTPEASNQACNAVSLLQSVAAHPDTRLLFLNAHIPLYLYPFLYTTCNSKPFEYLRLTSLGVIGALVKENDADAVSFLLKTEMVPLCFRSMEVGGQLSKNVATYIFERILQADIGLEYIFARADRFAAVGRILQDMVTSLAVVEKPPSSLLKHIICCYLRLSEDQRACEVLRKSLPYTLGDGTFSSCLHEDPTTKRKLQQLINNVSESNKMTAAQAGGLDHMVANQARVL